MLLDIKYLHARVVAVASTLSVPGTALTAQQVSDEACSALMELERLQGRLREMRDTANFIIRLQQKLERSDEE